MKKSIKMLTLSLLATGMLVGCGGGNPEPAGPGWSNEQKEAMRQQLHGEVLPFIPDQSDLDFTSGNGYVRIDGGEISPDKLASYAELYVESEGWVLQDSYKPEGATLPLAYVYEKSVTTAGGKRFVSVQFGGVDSEYKFVENGNLIIWAEDPYYYDWAEVSDEVLVYTFEVFESREVLPSISADYYQIYDDVDEDTGVPYMLLYCFTSDAESADKYYGSLVSGGKWKAYPGEEDEDVGVFYVADSPDAKYGIQYFYSKANGCLIVYLSKANYSYKFPAEEMNSLVGSYGSTATVPALEGDYYLYNAKYECALVYFNDTPEAADAGYCKVLADAGWDVAGYVDSVQEYIATSADGKASIRFYFEANEGLGAKGGVMVIEVTGPAFSDEFPTEEVSDFIGSYFYAEDIIPDVEGATNYVFNSDYGLLGMSYESEEIDGGYSALLKAAGFEVSYYSESDEGVTIFFAYSPLTSLLDMFYFDYLVYYSYSDGVLSVGLTHTYAMQYIENDWPADALEEMFSINGYEQFDVPAFESSTAFYIAQYDTEDGLIGKEIVGAFVIVAGPSADEIRNYLISLNNASWSIADGSTAAAGYAMKEIADEGIAVVEWMTEAVEVEEGVYEYYFGLWVYFGLSPIGFEELPADDIQAFFVEFGVSNVPVGDYVTANPDAYFTAEPYGDTGFDVCVYNTTDVEQGAYVDSLVEAGWTIVSDVDPDYPYDAILKYGDTGAYVSVVDYTDYYGYVDIYFYFVEPPLPNFPLDKVNAFLAEYGLGFSLSAGLPDPSGSGYSVSEGVDYYTETYHYISVTVKGDALDTYLNALMNVLTGAGYELDEYESDINNGSYVYINEDNGHQVNIEYSAYYDETSVTFWE